MPTETLRALALDPDYLAHVERLRPGAYFVEYTDSTHLEINSWTRLFKIEIADSSTLGYPEEAVFGTFYTVSLEPEPTSKESDNIILADQLAQSFVRTGILRPNLSRESATEIFNISKHDALILIPDTNALANGSLHWLLQSLSSTNIWIFPIVISLTQIQQQHSGLKAWSRKTNHGKLRDALRARTLVNASLGLLERCGERYQVLEVDPQLLRYVRPAGRGSSDPDEGDVLEDRLLIEAIHSVLGATRSRTEKRVLTADVLLARILHAESIPTLLLQTPILGAGQTLSSIRYEPLARAFQGAPLSQLLWDLAHSFGTVRLCDLSSNEVVKVGAYWAGKTALDWTSESLDVSLTSNVGEEVPASTGQIVPGSFSKATVPEASLLQVLRIAGSVLSGASDIDGVLSFFADEDRPSKSVTRMALEVLLRACLIEGDENLISPTAGLTELDRSLAEGDLDRVSTLMEEFKPYQELLSMIHEERVISPTRPSSATRTRLFGSSIDAFERLVRFPVYLGQAWTHEGGVRDGSVRPRDEEASLAFQSVFEANNRDRLSPLSTLLPLLARELATSPWALSKQLQAIVERGGLSEFSFEPAVGKKTISRDQVVTGSLRALNVEPVPLDRLRISGRPVFTVERRG
jgi:hypothetical protein